LILIAIGANLSSLLHGPPEAACEAAIGALGQHEMGVERRSIWYRSAPVPASEQPDFVNGVVAVETQLNPDELLAALHYIEDGFGRIRRIPGEARVLDLDLIAYGDIVCGHGGGGLTLPHPRLDERAFVLLPLVEIAPEWCHPVLGLTARELLRRLPAGPLVEPLDAAT
jgi:2-amino-4-hydroxy-6-hydroxymethyldihydropteridine diphosphokinase